MIDDLHRQRLGLKTTTMCMYVMVVQLGDDAHGCAGGGRERGGDRSGGGRLFGPQCGLDCREGARHRRSS
jgi:hypothetical protein